jgi:putative ABC transport system permease protein
VSVLNRKLLRELRSSGGMLCAIGSIIAVGVACLVTMGSAYWNLTEAKQRYYVQCRMADFWIDLKKAPRGEIERLVEMPGVAEVRPRIGFPATVDVEDVPRPLGGLVLSLPDRREPVLCDIVLRRGGYFSDRREQEVIVGDAFARARKIEPGDVIRLVLNNRRQELLVVGTAISSEFIYTFPPGGIVPDPEHFGIFYVKHSYAENVFDFDGAANQALGRFSPDLREDPRLVLRRVEDALADYGVLAATPRSEQASHLYVSQEIDGLEIFAVFMPAIFLAVAALVLNVLLTRLADQQRTVVGTLKALGYSDAQVFFHFLKFGLAVGLGGAAVGCAGGYWLAEQMTVLYRQYFEFPELENRFYPGLTAAALAVAAACAAVGSLRGARAVLRLKPAEAMRPKPPPTGGAILLERVPWLWRRLSSGWRMVVRGVVRHRVRTLAGVFAAMMGAAVLVSGFMMAEATSFLIDFQFRWVLRSDVELAFRDERGPEALDEAARLPGVDRAEPVLHVAGTFFNGPHRKKGGVMGLQPDATLTQPRDRQARPVRIPPTGLAMSRKMAEILRVERGDWIAFEPVRGLRRRLDVQVVEITDSYLGTAVYADLGFLGRLIGEESALSGAQLAIDRRPSHTDALHYELKQMPALEAVNFREDLVKGLETTVVETMWVFIGTLVLFAGVMFFGSILTSSLVSLAERQREIATLRVLGYGPWQIGSLLLRESLLATAVGTLLGMPLGYLLTVAMAAAYESEMFRFPVVHSPGTWIWTLVLAAVFTLTAHLAVQRTIHRMDWLDALKAQE